MKRMNVLVACEFSGIVRDAFSKKGHNTISCDLLPTEREGRHVQGDVLKILNYGPNRWKERSRFYEGIATAMAEQWGS